MNGDEEKKTPTAELSRDEPISSSVTSKSDDRDNLKQSDGSGASPSPSTKNTATTNTNMSKAKSCKGCLYYSSRMKANSRNPFCAGLTRSLPNLPDLYVGQSEVEASQEGRTLTDFRYGCVGYSLYADRKGENINGQGTQTELPVCMGLEILVDLRVNATDSAPAPAPATHMHNRDDGNGLPQRRSPRPTNSSGEEFLSRGKKYTYFYLFWSFVYRQRKEHTDLCYQLQWKRVNVFVPGRLQLLLVER